MIVEWKEGIRDTPDYTAYMFEVWVDGVLWERSNVKSSTLLFFEFVRGLFR